jgi:hypothetical protein
VCPLPTQETGFCVPSMTRLLPIAIIAVVAAGLLGQFPRQHPLLGALHVTLPSLHTTTAPGQTTTAPSLATRTTSHHAAAPRLRLLHLPHFASKGTSIVLRGHAPTAGKVTVRGSYDGRRWHTLTTPHAARAWKTRIYLAQRGQLHLRVLYPDGSRAVGSIRIV